jgi:3-dehydroquinate dehydratase-1
MTVRRAIKHRPRVVGVIASRADLGRAARMRRPPDLFELRLDRLTAPVVDRLENMLLKLGAPLIITARHPHEGGSGQLSLRKRHALLARFLDRADYVDVELRSARAMRSLLALAGRKKIGRIISYHSFKSTPSVRMLSAKAREAKEQRADLFKVATRTDKPMELERLLDFMTSSRVNLPLAVMGIGKLGGISRVLFARTGSVFIYASLGGASDLEGQLSLNRLAELGIGTMTRYE